MAERKSLPPEALYRRCDPEQFQFISTADLEDLTEFVGQDRALEAVRFGVGMRRPGFNLFLLGPAGMGKYAIARAFLEKRAAGERTPDEWCYINNFDSPEAPHALRLPPGRGAQLCEDVHGLLENLRSAIPSAFQTENYTARKHVIEQEIKDRQEKAFEEIQQQANEKGIALLRTPTGLIFAPMRGGQVISPEDFQRLPESEHQQIEAGMTELQEKLRAVLQQVPRWEQEGREKIRELNNEVSIFAVGHLIEDVWKKYADLAEVVIFLNDIQEDVIENVDEFLTPSEHPLAALMGISLPYAPKGSAFSGVTR